MMMDDISEMVCEAVIDFMQKTYQMFSPGEKHSTVPAVYFRSLSTILRNTRAVEIEEGKGLGFAIGECRFVFSGGDIFALKNGKIVGKKTLAEFAKRPAQTFRTLQHAIGFGEEM